MKPPALALTVTAIAGATVASLATKGAAVDAPTLTLPGMAGNPLAGSCLLAQLARASEERVMVNLEGHALLFLGACLPQACRFIADCTAL